jgi:hypothetical protein
VVVVNGLMRAVDNRRVLAAGALTGGDVAWGTATRYP